MTYERKDRKCARVDVDRLERETSKHAWINVLVQLYYSLSVKTLFVNLVGHV